MTNLVIKLKYGNTNTFFIKGTNGNLLIDTDYPGTMPAFYKEIKKNDIRINDITYALATHYHPDHIGLLSEFMEQGVKLILIDTQSDYIHYADEIFSRDNRIRYVPINKSNAILLKCEESREFLHSIGIEGEIVSTPSHSKDSVSLALDDGTCLVGDLEPISFIDAYENNIALKEDWKLIMKHNPKKIFYAHANEQEIS